MKQLENDLILSCWIIEAARSAALERRGHAEAAVRSAERARILASRCAAAGIKIAPAMAREHGEFISNIAGTDEELGALGQIFLQRSAAFIDAHMKDLLSEQEHRKLVELGAHELDGVNAALMAGRLFYPPPAEFPSAPISKSAGEVIARFGILGDPHVGPAGSNEAVELALEEMLSAGADFVVAIGDLTSDGEEEQFFTARKIFDKAAVPVIVTLGNHDMFAQEGGRSLGLERFTKAFGTEPNAVHEHNGVRVIVLNSADPRISPFPPFDMMTGEFEDAPPHVVPGGTFSEETLQWMQGVGSDGRTFILLHHPPYPYLGMAPLVFALDRASTDELAELAERVDARAILCGHTHRCHLTELNGIPVFELASCTDWPFGYSMVEVTERGWSLNLYPVPYEAEIDPMSHRDWLFRRYSTGPVEARSFKKED
jgi:predicted phosphodiesterase